VNVKALREEYSMADEAHRKLLEKRYGRRNIQRLVEDSFTEEWLTDNSKQCPKCSAHIEVSNDGNMLSY